LVPSAEAGASGALRRSLLFGATVAGGFALLASCRDRAPSVEQGKLLYKANGCASCHGPDGHGDGSVAPNLPAPPTDFRAASLSQAAIDTALLEGIARAHTDPALQGTHHELLMPKFDHLSVSERRSIGLYLMSSRTESGGP